MSKRLMAQAFKEEDWKFAQASRLELQRHNEREARQAWFDAQAAAWQEQQQQEWAAGENWGSWWQSPEGQWWGSQWWTQEEAWWSSFHAEPTASWERTEPTAGGASSSSDWQPDRTPEEDKAKLRDATFTPASFMPQRWVMYAIGRPVVVLRGFANPSSVYRSYQYLMKIMCSNSTWSHVCIMILMVGIYISC